MSKLKIIALIVFINVGITAVSANAPTSYSAPITIPCVKNKWYAGVTALYLQPNFGGNSLGYSSFSNYGTDFFNNQVEVNGAPNNLSNIVPNRAWGFRLEGGYEFGNSNNLDINWYHLNENTSGHFPSRTLFAGSASALYAGQFEVKPRWDAVNLELGQRFDLNASNILNLHAGLQFSEVKTTFINSPQLTPTSNPIFTTKDAISYRGLGPHVGADYLYTTCSGFGFYAKGAGSLLVGTAKQSVSGYRDLGGFNLYSTGNYNQSNNNVIVPELDADLGLQYHYQLQQGQLSLNLGYMFVTYLGALVSQVGAGVVSSSISTSSSTNFNLNGPYLGVTWAE